MMKKIGLLGGTFDPIHNGHIHLALMAYQTLNLDSVHFIPAAQPLLRSSPLASEADRLEMVRLGIADYPFFKADDREIQRGGNSYMIDTLAQIRAEHPSEPLYLILGLDQFCQFSQWKDWQKMPSFAHIVVSHRHRTEMSADQLLHQFILKHQTEDLELLQNTACGHLFFLQSDMLPVSSTEIRERLIRGKDVRNLLPEKVWKYICQKHLYRIG